MAKKTEEVEAIFIRERQRWGETTITTCIKNEDAERYAKIDTATRDPFGLTEHEGREALEQTIKLDCDEGELEPGITYRFYGSWMKHWKYGDQFHCKTFTKITPHDKTGVINYLMKAPGIGKVKAEKLWKTFSGEAVKKLRENPADCGVVLQGSGPNPSETMMRRMEEAAAYLEQEKDLEDATIDVVSLFAGRGFPKRLSREVIRKFGNLAAETVRKNPYKLMQFKGVGFLKADAMYLDLGGNPAKLKRQALAIWHGIVNDSDGHTWFGVEFVKATLRERIAGTEAKPLKAIKLSLRSGLLEKNKDFEQRPWFSTRRMSEDEYAISIRLAFLATRDSAWPSLLMSQLSVHQQEQLEIATSKPIGIFAGDPGTGKSFTAARLVSRIAELNGYGNIAVIAPTGKAAVRVTEAMNECGVDIRAKTVHSLLRVISNEGGTWSFEHGETNPIEERYVIVDESSMLDVPIMASLVRAMRNDGHLLLVGDLQQLPPVGHGAPLRDLLAAGVPFGNLTEIRRNSGEIVRVCQKIREERPVNLPDRIDSNNNIALRRAGNLQAANKIEALVLAVRDRKLSDPVWDVQVIVALNDKSDLSRKNLNKRLQGELNRGNKGKTRFWINDKIVCLRNQMLPVDLDSMESVGDDLDGMIGESSSGDATAYVANGEIGRVIAVYPNKVVMEFFSPKRVVVCPTALGSDPEGFDLGYAISCHKSQGSQWKVVIIALDPSGGAHRVCDRSWIYTAISRAQEVCFLVGKDRTLTQYCQTQKIDKRKTFLKDRFSTQLREFEKGEQS
jgi:exodeoxyribonuclease V alpha subunit